MPHAAVPLTPESLPLALELARRVIRQEADALLRLAERLDTAFGQAADLIGRCPGHVVVTGVGKAGLIGQKIAATLASTGTASHFLHPVEAMHGDLGRVREQDVLLALSMSGRTEEVLRLVAALSDARTDVIAITSSAESPLGRAAHVTLVLGEVDEACPLGLAPSTSTTAMLALGDALAFAVSQARGFRAEDFARLHPGGSLGRKLAVVDQVMRPLQQCRLARPDETIRQLLIRQGTGRRTGAVMIVDSQQVLVGIFTDGDLARVLAHEADAKLDRPLAEVMTRTPKIVRSQCRVEMAVKQLTAHKISQIPVVDGRGRPVGLIEITDVLSYVPPDVLKQSWTQDAWREGAGAGAEPQRTILPFPQR